MATIVAGKAPFEVAITQRAYVANNGSDSVSVITSTILVGTNPNGVAITPDGTFAYVANNGDNTVSKIVTATRAVGTIGVGAEPNFVAITPDGTAAYVTNGDDGTVSVISMASDAIVTTVTVGSFPNGIAFTPDGLHAYIANDGDNTVSVIDTATHRFGNVPAGKHPYGVAIKPPSPGLTSFSAGLDIRLAANPKEDFFRLEANFTLARGSRNILPVAEAVTLGVGPYTTVIAPGAFKPVPKERSEESVIRDDRKRAARGVDRVRR